MISHRPVIAVENGAAPLATRIASAVANDVRRGRLHAGDALPSSRELADSLGVHRNTVIAAYRELELQGFVEPRAGRGTFVADELPDRVPRERAHRGLALETAFPLRHRTPTANDPILPKHTIALYGGVPDVTLAPSAELARAIRRVLRRKPKQVLSYGDERGSPALRRSIARMLRDARGLVLDADDVLVTRGAQMALDLVARCILTEGDVVAVEALGYRPAWNALAATGATLRPVPIDEDGIDVEALAAIPNLRAVYVTPHHQYPTTVVLSAARRMRLLELARTRRFAILEDDYDHEFHYDGHPVLPLAAHDGFGAVVYIGTLSKVLAPGLRIGYAVAPRPLLERLTNARRHIDRQNDLLVEEAVADLFDDGDIERHVRRARRHYLERRDAFVTALRSAFDGEIAFETPIGGMSVWAHVPSVDVDAWLARALPRGVAFHTGKRFTFDGRARPFVRLGFAAHEPRVLREAVRTLRDTLETQGDFRG